MVKKALKILFRVSGGRAKNKEYGLGHIYHAMNLASRLKNCKFVFLLEDYGQAKQLLKRYKYNNIFLLKKDIDVKLDVEITKKIITEQKIDLIIVDKHDNKTKSYAKLMTKFIKTVVISDVRKINYHADLLINAFIGFKNSITKNPLGTKCLLGPKYQILNKKYENQKKITKKKYSFLITFGGFDEQNLLETFCDELEKYLENLKVKIILGYATYQTKKLRSLKTKFPHNIDIILETSNLKKEISQSSFGICSGGITTYEFAALGVPFAIVCQYKHQIATAKEWEKKGYAINLGYPNSKTKYKIRKVLNDIFEKKIIINPKNNVVDGLGAKRVAQKILNLVM